MNMLSVLSIATYAHKADGNRMKIFLILLFVSMLALTPVTSYAMDLGDWVPNEDASYSSMLSGEEYSIGDIVFYSLEDRMPYEELSDLDKYILAGASLPGTNKAKAPWFTQFLSLVQVYYEEKGTLPSVMDDDEILSLSAFQNWESQVDFYRNVFTDGWVRLDARSPEPGNTFVKVLSKEEKIYLASRLPYFKRRFFMDLPQGISPEDHDVFYYCIYGSNGILTSSVYFREPKNL